MAYTRGSWPRQKRNAEGKRICRNCEGPLPNQHRSYCSKECSDAFWLRHSPSHARHLLMERDHGVCAGCKLDTVALEKTIEGWKKAYSKWKSRQRRRTLKKGTPDYNYYGHRYYLHGRQSDIHRWLTERGFNIGVSLWDADHIVPVVENGGECGLENYQTLCVPCHKAKTKEEARRRSKTGNQERLFEPGPQLAVPSLP